MVRNGATFDHQSDEVLGVAWIENPIHNGPQATVLGDMALQRCWHPRIQDPVAHRRKGAAEVGEIIPTRADPHALAQSRRPMDMMIQGWSMRRFHAEQQWSTMSA